jgi:phospholipid/cholesterol/gamma-HCH transport system substrate-binding protein
MKRLAAITLVLAAAAAGGSLLIGSSAQGSSTARFDVIFDDARGLIGGQLVKVAGANAGTIENVTLTPDFKARIEATIDSKFIPFHQNATCIIRPQGLIAENYVDCDPGNANSPVLQATGGHPPTVPVQNTTEPVSLLDLFNMFNLPTRQRFMVIINELGIGTSGRGQDFNDVLRRANPALGLARQAIGILTRQKAQLATLIDTTNTIAAEAAGHTGSLQSFLDHAGGLATLTAAHRDRLSAAINRLPGLLAQTQPALQQLDTVAVNGTPLVQQLHAAVPSLNQVANDLGPFVAAAKPGLAQLGIALRNAIPAIHAVTPLLGVLRSYTTGSAANTKLMGHLFVNLQQHGFVENFISTFYYLAALTARYDSRSHIAPTYLTFPPNPLCPSLASKPTALCSANYGSQPTYTPSQGLARRAEALSTPSSAAPAAAAATGAGRPASPPAATRGQPASPPAATGGQPAPQGGEPSIAQTLQNLVSYLLK